MRIAVLSGKGGTGKTTVAGSLVSSLEESRYVDCDVEEPNGAIFFKPVLCKGVPVKVLVPAVDEERCTGCGACARACQFKALAVVKKKVLTFPELCHHCGACRIACPQDAIREVERTIGVIETNADLTFMQGRLSVGEPIGIPVLKELKRRIVDDVPVVLDCPPGTSCSVVQAIEDCDYCLLVTEPTPFGLHDLELAVKLVELMEIPCGVVINKASDTDKSVQAYCTKKGIEVLMEIPFSQNIARAYSKGILPTENDSSWKLKFRELFRKVEGSVGK